MRETRAASPIALTRAALRLRAWARPLLLDDRAGGPPAPPPASTAAWGIFLAAERCAGPLLARAGEVVEASALRTLRSHATAELQRILGARRAACRVARIAESIGAPVALLKGGVHVFDEEAYDLVDVDLLVPLPHAATLVARVAGADHAAPPTPGSPHAPAQYEPGGATIEIHHALGDAAPANDEALWARSAPHGREASLRTLAPADHLAHVLAHAAIAHPQRRGTLRDLLVLRAAVRRAPADVAAAVDALPLDRRGVARSLLDAVAGPARDAFADVAAASYLLRALAHGRLGALAADPSFALAVYPFLGPAADRRDTLRAGLQLRPPAGRWATFRERAPLAASVARVALSVLRYPPAAVVAFAARLIAHDAPPDSPSP